MSLPEDDGWGSRWYFAAPPADSCPVPARTLSHMPTPPRRTAVVVAAACLALAACSGGSTPAGAPAASPSLDEAAAAAVAAIPTPEGMDPQLLQPLVGLGPCEDQDRIRVIDAEVPDPVVLPPGALLTEVDQTGPLTNLQGYVPLTPVQTRVFYQEMEDAEILQVEDEIREAEVLLSRLEHRTFFKSQAVCEQGSIFVAVLAPEVEDGALPAPAGDGTVTTEAPSPAG